MHWCKPAEQNLIYSNLFIMPPKAKLQQLNEQGHGFATYPEVRIVKEPNSKSSIQHLLFGDYITPPKSSDGRSRREWTDENIREVETEIWIKIRCRQEEGWIRLAQIQTARLLEVNFIDVGQGDGCHLVTPTDEHFIIDAGEKDNMYRFLRWRFHLSAAGKKLPTFHAVITHPDEDHYGGFELLLSKPPANQKRSLAFEKVYFNGIVQRAGSTLGKTEEVGGINYLVEIAETDAALKEHLKGDSKKSNYEKLLQGAVVNQNSIRFEFLFAEPPEQTFLYNDGALSIEVLAPVPEKVAGQRALRWFDEGSTSISKTKNGHSVALMACMGNMKVFLSGDINAPAADYLMEQHSGINVATLRKSLTGASALKAAEIRSELEKAIGKCKKKFEAHVAKSCHHGSHDITNEFLRTVNPIATVISSGDEESFCHPRPETLGAIGRFSRGERPLIYSTELARSSPEYIEIVKEKIKSDKIKQRIVSVYGMITLRTDGEKAIIAQKLEKPASPFGLLKKWQIEKLEWDDKLKDFVTL